MMTNSRFNRMHAARQQLHSWLEQNGPPSPALKAKILAKCARDPVFWISMFGTTYDPRKRIPSLPFVLFDFQEALVRKLAHAIQTQDDLLIEKSRDMGVSWVVLMVFQWFWLFHPGCHFLLGSRKADFVDRLGDMGTLMQKCRFNLNQLPAWMLPDGYQPRRHDALFKLINPVFDNAIVGESANENFGRGGRYTAIMLDEFAYWPSADLSFAAAAQSSPCRIVVSTPFGRQNKFAQLRFGSEIPYLTIHWRQHPEKDEAWYQRQRRSMTLDEMARELDINYSLATEDRVFREFNIIHQQALQPLAGIPILRSWDFGYHCPAVLFMQMDAFGRLRVLHEMVGQRVQLKTFAQAVIEETQERFPGYPVEDYADPAGHQKSDRSEATCIELLNTLGIYPGTRSVTVFDSLELLRMAFTDIIDELPGVLIDPGCQVLIQALEGGYRYKAHSESPLEEHPYEDVVDCLRYVAIHKLPLNRDRPPRRMSAKQYIRPRNKTTGY